MSVLEAVLTSAAVATLVTSLLSILGQFLERRARRRELLLSKAIELANLKNETLMMAAGEHKTEVLITDAVINAEVYYRALLHLLRWGVLPKDLKDKDRSSEAKYLGK